MCSRLKVIEQERRSVDARGSHNQQLLNPDDEFDIYKTQQDDRNRRIIQTQSGKNKQEIIMKLNNKIDNMFKETSQDKKHELNIKTGSFASKLNLCYLIYRC